jgi:hypothetical protein
MRVEYGIVLLAGILGCVAGLLAEAWRRVTNPLIAEVWVDDKRMLLQLNLRYAGRDVSRGVALASVSSVEVTEVPGDDVGGAFIAVEVRRTFGRRIRLWTGPVEQSDNALEDARGLAQQLGVKYAQIRRAPAE